MDKISLLLVDVLNSAGRPKTLMHDFQQLANLVLQRWHHLVPYLQLLPDEVQLVEQLQVGYLHQGHLMRRN